jgi:hypothetical protein
MAGIESEGWAERDDGQKSLRIGVHHADAVVWGPVYITHLGGHDVADFRRRRVSVFGDDLMEVVALGDDARDGVVPFAAARGVARKRREGIWAGPRRRRSAFAFAAAAAAEKNKKTKTKNQNKKHAPGRLFARDDAVVVDVEDALSHHEQRADVRPRHALHRLERGGVHVHPEPVPALVERLLEEQVPRGELLRSIASTVSWSVSCGAFESEARFRKDDFSSCTASALDRTSRPIARSSVSLRSSLNSVATTFLRAMTASNPTLAAGSAWLGVFEDTKRRASRDDRARAPATRGRW